MSSQVKIENIPLVGATFNGISAKKITIELDTGVFITFDLSKNKSDDREAKKVLNLKSKIVDDLKSKGEPQLRKQIARHIGNQGTSGRFGVAVRSLLDEGVIFEDEGGLLSLDEDEIDGADLQEKSVGD